MIGYLLPPFGQIELEALNEDYYSKIKLDGRDVKIDINFAKTSIAEDVMNSIKYFIENISHFDRQNKGYIDSDFKDENGETVKEYLVFHVTELGDEFFEQLGIDSNQTDYVQQFLARLHLIRVGLYPDGKYGTSYFAVFDYTVDRNLSDQLLVVKTDNKGNLDHLTWES